QAPHARSRLGIGRSYQIPQPFTHMTVFENLLVGAIFGGRRSERESYAHCAEVLELTELIGRANVPARTLTLLQRKRLELRRASSHSIPSCCCSTRSRADFPSTRPTRWSEPSGRSTPAAPPSYGSSISCTRSSQLRAG